MPGTGGGDRVPLPWQASNPFSRAPRALEGELVKPRTDAKLRAFANDRYLSLMSLRSFRAGLKHSMVDARLYRDGIVSCPSQELRPP